MLPQRKLNRLTSFDYASINFYYITVCAKNKKHYFGKIENSKFVPNKIGKLIQQIWYGLPEIFLGIELDHFQIMPNHLHGILIFSQPPKYKTANKPATLSQIIGALKSKTNVFARREILPKYPKLELWQKTFYDRVIRNDKELDKIREYITNNPKQWELDEYYKAGAFLLR